MSKSSWDTASNDEYDESRFYCSSTDGRGHGISIRAQLPPQLGTMISTLIHSGNYPYKSVGDVIRDALTHRLHYLADDSNNVELLASVQRIAASTRLDMMVNEAKFDRSFVDRIKNVRDMVLPLQNVALLQQLLAEIDGTIDTLAAATRREAETVRADVIKALAELRRKS